DSSVTGVQTCALPIFLGAAPVLRQQPGSALGQLVDARRMLAMLADVVDDRPVEPLQPDQAFPAEQFRHVVGRGRRVRIPDDKQRSEERRVGKAGKYWG